MKGRFWRALPTATSCITESWPGQMRTVYGDHERFVQTYFSTYKGKYFTGDGCRRDNDGYYWITGRVDDVINVSGHRMGTAEVESALVSHDTVSEAAVVGYPHDIKGQGIYCYVTLMSGVEATDDLRKALVAHVRKEIGAIASPDKLQFAPGLPKTRSGKIMRRILRKIAEDDFSAPWRYLDAGRPRRRRRPHRQPPEQEGIGQGGRKLMEEIEIEEVIGRSEQGVTQPYICRASDGSLYYVKGKGAGYPSLVKEWVAGQLARRFGLPIPDFAVLSVPRTLYDLGKRALLSDLGHGPVFGSKAMSAVSELTMADAQSLPSKLGRDIAVFDWWVMNGDRTLSASGGNPNILWSAHVRKAFIIDHNLAFDEMTTLRSLEESHVFGASLSVVKTSAALQIEYARSFEKCLKDWKGICDDIPERWHYVDDVRSKETGFDLARAEVTLLRFVDQRIWGA